MNNEQIENRLKCPKCRNGFAGNDHTGEACDCHYCGGQGFITAEAFCDLQDRFQSLVGDAMAHEITLKEARDGAGLIVLEEFRYWRNADFPSTGDPIRDALQDGMSMGAMAVASNILAKLMDLNVMPRSDERPA